METQYFLRMDHEREWHEATKDEFIAAEVKSGFRARNGKGHTATSHFVGVQTHIVGCSMAREGDVYESYPIDLTPPEPVKSKALPKPAGKTVPKPVKKVAPPKPCVNHNWTHYGDQKPFDIINRKTPLVLYWHRRCMSCERIDELENVTVFGKDILKKWGQVEK